MTFRRAIIAMTPRGTCAHLAIASIWAFVSTAAAASTVLLHEFSGADGSAPLAAVTISGDTLYGTANRGGASDDGTLFKLNTDATGFQVLHHFAGGRIDGSRPASSVIVDGSTLYGNTGSGGTNLRGTLFKLNADGSAYQVLHNFTDYYLSPSSTLITYEGRFYGASHYGGGSGGLSDAGLIYRINTDGSGLGVVREFQGTPSDGFWPTDSVTVSGEKFFGTTNYGGTYGSGIIYSMNSDGSEYMVLHKFGRGADADRPRAPLTLVGATLYGTSQYGGLSNDGTIFRINTDGTGYEVLHEFGSGGADGAEPNSPLTLVGSELYGMTQVGGDANQGIIFKISLDGSGYKVLHDFAGGANDGGEPTAAFVLHGSTLYGTTHRGGDADLGTVFAFATPEPSTFILAALGILSVMACARGRRHGCVKLVVKH